MADVNRFGLRRSDLSEEIRRAVRQRCRFGCVVCGSAIIQYHHFDPPFEDATHHAANGITLLCGACHDKVTRGIWSGNLVRRQNRSPNGATHRPHALLDFKRPVKIILGSTIFDDVHGPALKFGDEVILALYSDEQEGVLLDARFFDEAGRPTIEVRRNELLLRADHWDATVIGRRIRVIGESRRTVLDATLHPPHALVVRELNVSIRGNVVRTDDSGRVFVTTKGGATIDLEDYCAVTGGCMEVSDESVRLTDGAALIPYPGRRLRGLMRRGEIDRFFAELAEPVAHVAQYRAPRRPRPSDAELRVDGAPPGMTRYRTLCDVCNEASFGPRDLPEGTVPRAGADGICNACALLPPDAWQVKAHREDVGLLHETMEHARAAALEWCRRNPPSHVIVHRWKDRAEFIFPADGTAAAGATK